MKHYSNEEFTRAERGFFKPETLKQLKHIAHGRERAALKRELLAEVAESDNDRIYWERELDAAVCEWLNLVDEDRCDSEFHEVYGWDGYDYDWYEMRYAEMRKRVNEAEYELAALAA